MDSASGSATVVASDHEAAGLAAHLLDRHRRLPCVVVTTSSGRSVPAIDAGDIAADVEGLAEVYVLPTGAPSWEFSRHLPEGTQVYGGAARVYPVGIAWTANRELSPLRFVFSETDAERVATELVSDALTMAHAAGILQARGSTTRQASGTVKGMVGGRALVDVAGGGWFPAVVWPELTAKDVPAERLFVTGMTVSGVLDETLNRLDVSGMKSVAGEVLSPYRAGSMVLGRVASVERERVKVELLPGFAVTVQAVDVTGDAGSDLRSLLTAGETVTAVVVRNGASTARDWRLRVTEPEDESHVLPAASVLPGGPPWLLLPRPEPAEPEETSGDEAPAVLPTPAAATTGAPEPVPGVAPEVVAGLTQEIADLRAMVARLQQANDQAERRQGALKTELRKSQDRARRAERELHEQRATLGQITDTLFADPEEQFRFDVYLAWARRTTAQDKLEHPMADYRLGPEFLATLEAVQGVDRSKVVDVAADVVSGRVHSVAARQTHQLRSGSGGDDPFVVGASGATCWRVSLQHKTAQARRMHYWHHPDGSIELSSIRLHDDFRP